ncbi:MAG: ATP-binding protein [Candidatus Promineofilum sp.]|nr:ATP-binding protein [Promineifilum sp.]
MVDSLRLLGWLLFRPSAWRARVHAFDARLSPHFCLAEVGRAFWADPAWRRLAVQWLLGWPLLAWLATLGVMRLLGPTGGGAPIALVIGLMVALSIGGVVSFGAGGLAGAVAAAIATTILAPPATLLHDLVLSPGMGVMVGAIAGVTGFALTAAEEPGRGSAPARRLGGLVIGILVSAIGLLIVLGVPTGVVLVWQQRLIGTGTVAIMTGLMPALIVGVVIGLRTRRWRRALALAVAAAILIGSLEWLVLRDVAYNDIIGGRQLLTAFLIVALSSFLILYALPFVIAERIAGAWAGAVAGLLASQALHPISQGVFAPYSAAPNLAAGLAFGVLFLTMGWWRPLLAYPLLAGWHTLLYRRELSRVDASRSLLRWHAAFWDEQQRWPLVGLADHLVLVMERYPEEGRRSLDRLSAGHQRGAAQAAQIEIDARHLERAQTAAEVAQMGSYLGVGQLEGPASALLRSLSRVSQDVAAALQQRSAYNGRLALEAIADRLDGIQRELTRSAEPYAQRFGPVVARWRELLTAHIRELTLTVERRQEIDNPYVIGVPLTAQQEVFVGRTDISRRIESLLLDRRRPPLLLYGQRRMGKTSLLNNLGRLLPTTTLPLFVDLQGHVSYASDLAGFFYNVARAMVRSADELRGIRLPFQPRATFAADPLTAFDEWLDEVERAALAGGIEMVLLMLDEFEALDAALVDGRLSEAAVLGSLRHLIQHRPRFKVLLAGSHPLQEFERWASYFINAQVIHIGYLREDEARQLVEYPVKEFALAYEPAASRRVLALTQCHPFLLQLLCGEVVALKNEQAPDVRRLASVEDVETAARSALEVGSMFFADIQWNQVGARERELLRALAAVGEGAYASAAELSPDRPSEETGAGLARLEQRGIIERTADNYRFRVELIRRWFAREDRL